MRKADALFWMKKDCAGYTKPDPLSAAHTVCRSDGTVRMVKAKNGISVSSTKRSVTFSSCPGNAAVPVKQLKCKWESWNSVPLGKAFAFH